MTAFDCDAVVIGAGVVGLACARSLAARGHQVVVLERHGRFGVETSSRNSEVIHAGIYYPPGSLKARLCVQGNRSLYEWCQSHGVGHRRTGKLVVASSAEETAKLEAILHNARECGVESLIEITPQQARAMEPNVRAVAALWSPDTGIVDSHELMASLLADLEAHGGAVAWNHALVAASPRPGGYRVVASAGGEETGLVTRWVVNSAGLEADRVASLPGLDVAACGYRLHYARGHYFRVHPRKSGWVSRLVYPTPAQSGLGIHVTVDLSGSLRLGPDVEYLEQRVQDYRVPERLLSTFHAAVSRYLAGIEPGDLAPDQAGIRPKLQGPGEPVRDFVVAEESERGLPGWVNLVGIESPGLTCALELGELVASRLEGTAVSV